VIGSGLPRPKVERDEHAIRTSQTRLGAVGRFEQPSPELLSSLQNYASSRSWATMGITYPRNIDHKQTVVPEELCSAGTNFHPTAVLGPAEPTQSQQE
jgi:hypothetical protein